MQLHPLLAHIAIPWPRWALKKKLLPSGKLYNIAGWNIPIFNRKIHLQRVPLPLLCWFTRVYFPWNTGCWMVILISWFMKYSPHNWVGHFIPNMYPKTPVLGPYFSLFRCQNFMWMALPWKKHPPWWYPSCLSPPRSPLKGNIPNKYPRDIRCINGVDY